jgi:hypothetical protein
MESTFESKTKAEGGEPPRIDSPTAWSGGSAIQFRDQ